MRVLIVEDNAVYGRLLVERLARSGFEADLLDTVATAREAVRRIDYAAILLDLGLPDEDGIRLLRELRSVRNTLPVIVTTARNRLDDRLDGLQAGADDYLVKPFCFDELLARLHAVLRRHPFARGTVLVAGNVALDIDGPVLRIAGTVVPTGPRELELLQLLLHHQEKVVTRDRLATGLFGRVGQQHSNAVDVYVHRLRRVLEASDAGVTIQTIRDVGYLLTASPPAFRPPTPQVPM
ncbi:MAG: response regulator transcription factor [Proteobacteria bacterium]|nr:response regulator transcription factor [Pseudomonadota bacterium]